MTDAATRPRSGGSIALRLAIAVALVLAAGGVAVTAAALAYGQQAAREAYDRLLIGAAGQIAAAVRIQQGELIVDIPVTAFELLALAPEERIAWRVIDPAGRTVTGDAAVAPPAGAAQLWEARLRGERFRFAATRRRFAERAFSGTVTVIVGQTMEARTALARDIAQSALVVLGLAGVTMAGLAAFAIRSALRPLRRIEASLAARDPNDLTPLAVAVPREAAATVAAIDRFMARLATQLTAMRRLIADSAHQLRTPVAGLRAQAELAADETDPERLRAIVARIHRRSVGLSRLTDQLLSHALVIHRAEAVPREPLDLRSVAIRAAEDFDPELFGAGTLRLDLPEEAVPVRGDALSLAEACKNLVANALRHGRGPVTLVVAAAGAEARLAVGDAGAGIPEADWATAGQRFAPGGGSEGAGLGLAIAQAVAGAHGGRLGFARGPCGFEAALVLPRGGA